MPRSTDCEYLISGNCGAQSRGSGPSGREITVPGVICARRSWRSKTSTSHYRRAWQEPGRRSRTPRRTRLSVAPALGESVATGVRVRLQHPNWSPAPFCHAPDSCVDAWAGQAHQARYVNALAPPRDAGGGRAGGCALWWHRRCWSAAQRWSSLLCRPVVVRPVASAGQFAWTFRLCWRSALDKSKKAWIYPRKILDESKNQGGANIRCCRRLGWQGCDPLGGRFARSELCP